MTGGLVRTLVKEQHKVSYLLEILELMHFLTGSSSEIQSDAWSHWNGTSGFDWQMKLICVAWLKNGIVYEIAHSFFLGRCAFTYDWITILSIKESTIVAAMIIESVAGWSTSCYSMMMN